MAANLAHDMRNTLVTLSLGLQYLEKILGPEGRHRETLQRLQRQVDRLNQIVDRFLAFSCPPKLATTSCDVTKVLEKAIKSWENDLTAQGIQVHRDYAQNIGELYLDAEQMEQVFGGLISNAIDAMPDGGHLYLRAYAIPLEQSPSQSSARPEEAPAGEVVVQVEDTGTGIPPEITERIFEPFFTTKPKSLGLGLTIAQQIVEAHGGCISAQNEPGQGATFTINLPRRV